MEDLLNYKTKFQINVDQLAEIFATHQINY